MTNNCENNKKEEHLFLQQKSYILRQISHIFIHLISEFDQSIVIANDLL